MAIGATNATVERCHIMISVTRVGRPTMTRTECHSSQDFIDRFMRVMWCGIWTALFRLSPTPMFAWRRVILRLFGAKVGRGVHVYSSARIWAPWNLEIGDNSCLGPFTHCYSVDRIIIGEHSTVSQFAFLCTAGHDIQDPQMRLTHAPIYVGDGAWVAADAFVGAGVRIGDGAVVGARAAVFKNV